ncbi:MAG: hypothetical protein IJQ56_11435 [Synergistaceae bacterium]|nr:hypothetical protein [Synergistaceae bacterium]
MTRKLYYEDLYAQEFDSEIVSQEEVNGSYNVILDKTLFYPSGGGQPCDLGFINGVEVLDVHEHNNEIIHVLSEKITGPAHGVIDWSRRFELMQQHLGEHIFAGMLYNLHNLHTLRMRIEGDNVSIDLGEDVDEKIIFEAESLANEAVYKNIPVEIIYPDMNEIKAHARKLPPEKSLESEPIRIVKIEGVDYVPCCGLHVSTTGQVGLIKVTSFENHKGGKRIYLRSGRAAYKWLADLHNEVKRAESELVCGYEGINEKILNLKSQIHDLKANNESLIEHFLEPVSRELIENAQTLGNNKLVKHIMRDSIQDEIKHLFRLLTSNNHDVIALLAGINTQGVFIMFGCNRDNKSVDVRSAFRKAIALLEGRGGGSAFSAQGWGVKSELINNALDEAENELAK